MRFGPAQEANESPSTSHTHDASSSSVQHSKQPHGRFAFTRVFAIFVSSSKNESVSCLVCGDDVGRQACFRAPCGHYYCPDCTVGMAEAAVAEGNEELFPLRCCNKPLPLKRYLKSLPEESLRASVAAKSKETSVPPPLRIYCPNETCDAFLGKSSGRKKDVSCPQCHTKVCSACKQIAHSPEPCKRDQLHAEAMRRAEQNGWKVCPGCTVIVERNEGCDHMTCPCGAEFCYQCGKRMERCRCRRS